MWLWIIQKEIEQMIYKNRKLALKKAKKLGKRVEWFQTPKNVVTKDREGNVIRSRYVLVTMFKIVD